MALHLNLYHEVQKQQALQRRDPMKFAVIGLAAVAASLAVYYLLQLNSTRTVTNELKSLEAEFAKQSPRAAKAKVREEEIKKTLKVSEALVNRIEKRFYWAPVLSSIAQVVPPQVQITKLSGDVTSDRLQRCSLVLEGVAAGEDPRKIAEDLRRSLAEQFSTKFKEVNSVFRSLEDSPEMVRLQGQKLPTVTFGINVVMQTTETPAPPPPPAAAPKKAQTPKKEELL